MKLAIVGAGRLGQILARQYRRAVHIGGRRAMTLPSIDSGLGDVDVVVHAAGPAGEAVSVLDPGGSFALHYTLTERLVGWVQRASHRRLILLGTVAPDVGFYGPLKRAAIRMAQHRLAEPGGPKDALTVIECGHVIGKEMSVHESPGVVAKFIHGAVTDGVLLVPEEASVSIRLTPVSALLTVIDRVVHVPIEFPSVISIMSEPILLHDLADRIARLADIIYRARPEIMTTTTLPGRHSYADPTGDPVDRLPSTAITLTLQEWMADPAVKLLFRPRAAR